MILQALEEIRAYSAKELATIWDEIKRFVYPQEILCRLK